MRVGLSLGAMSRERETNNAAPTQNQGIGPQSRQMLAVLPFGTDEKSVKMATAIVPKKSRPLFLVNLRIVFDEQAIDFNQRRISR